MCMSANPRIHGLQNRCNAGWRPVVREKAFLGSPSPSAVTWRASYNLSTFEFIFLSRKQLFSHYPHYPTTMLCKSFVLHFVILSIVAFSTGLAIPTSISPSDSNHNLMGRAVNYVRPNTSPISVRDSDDLDLSRRERFHYRLDQLRRWMGTTIRTPATPVDEWIIVHASISNSRPLESLAGY